MKCLYCGEPMVSAKLLVSDGRGVQRQGSGQVCGPCGRVMITTQGPEEQMDWTPREIEIKADADRRVDDIAKELAQARETLQARWETIQDLNDRLKEQTALAETRIGMFNDMQAKFVEVNAKYQSLRDREPTTE